METTWPDTPHPSRRAAARPSPSAGPGSLGFNRACRFAALLWLAVTIPPGLHFRPTDSDFQQFYAGGVMIREGVCEALYPIPHRDSHDNPGMKPDSDLRPAAAEVYRRRGVPDITHFMLPPPSAPLFVPLSGLTYPGAEWVWVGLLTLCTWGVAVCAGHFSRRCLGRESYWEGVLAMAIVLSPMACRAIRIRNCTPPIALCFAVAALGLLRPGHLRTAAAILLGALLKYATLVLLPVVLATRRWRTAAWFASLAASSVLLTRAQLGPGPFRTFATEIAPTLSRPSAFAGNQTLPGLFLRVTKVKPQPPWIVWGLRGAQGATFLALCALIFSLRREHRKSPAAVFAASAALIAWLMIFSPVAWEHWPIFLAPWWGWLAWEARQSLVRRVAAGAAVLLMAFPLSIFTNPGFLQKPWVLPEPWNSSQLWGVVLVLGLAAARLARPGPVLPSSLPHDPGAASGARPDRLGAASRGEYRNFSRSVVGS